MSIEPNLSVALSDALAELRELIARNDTFAPEDRASVVTQAKREVANRTACRLNFPGNSYSEATWQMLLELYIADHEQKAIAVTSLCFASGEPQTTALRWINLLEEHGLIMRKLDRVDGRRKLVRLTHEGRRLIKEHFRKRPYQLV
ncbi:winged helix DNA-binding protein [Altererythrobacter sp. GH1-8]|uniref:winged helix DNA-binding protein n=1 Tax=Altererythrobacter sp. GH1-8 TaxID=3349333 RepID=UPI00374D91E8